MTDAAELAIARDAIRDLVATYAHAVDRGRVDEVTQLFAPEGVLELADGRRMTGRTAIGDFLREAGATVRAGALGPRLLRHHVSSHHVVLDGPRTAHGWAYFVVFSEQGPDHWGRYRDAYVHTGGAWRFASRHVRVDGRASTARTANDPG